jgi:hypothetical protein
MRHLRLFLEILGVMFQDTYNTFSDADHIKTVKNVAHTHYFLHLTAISMIILYIILKHLSCSKFKIYT